MRDRAISSKFSTHRVPKECNLCNFQKIFPSPKMAAILNFRIFAKNGKNTNLLLSPLPCEMERFRRNFSTHRIPKECNLCNFQKNFPLPKNGGLFEFLPKMAKHKFASISLTVRDRAILSKFSTHRVPKECNLCKFPKNFPLPKNGGHFEFSNFCQKWQNTNLLLSP